MTPPHLQRLVDRGVITVDASGVARLTREAWRKATQGTGYEEYQTVHFVGFKDDRLNNAVKVWGRPDFYHRFYDQRAVSEFAPGDVVVFAYGDEHQPVKANAYDDSANF